ncbi:MAG: NUDIX domain-containing protein [Desulfobacterales bacterium]|nr:NUDIX domain-containing protein [Desulfobacterales bacterium]
MPVRIDDPRLSDPQCVSLTPVRTVHINPWFVVQDRGGYFTVEYKQPQVIILPIIDNHSILMVRVKRPVIADSTLELPAGSVKRNEPPLAAAAREFAEETGIEIEDTRRFIVEAPISNSPNRTPTLTYIYHIVLSQAEYDFRSQHDDEIESVGCYRFKELKRMLISGKIYVSVPAAVIGRYLLQKCFS